MSLSVSLKPMVSNFAPSFKSSEAKDVKAQINELEDKSKSQKLNDLSVMSARLDLESKLNETKSAPVQYVEEAKPARPVAASKEVDKSSYITAPSLDSTVKKFQDGKAPSRVEQEAVLTDQMNQMAVNNKILHGLA